MPSKQRKPTVASAAPAAVRARIRTNTVTGFCDHRVVADEAVALFQASGVQLDFSTASVAALDVVLSERFGSRGLDPDAELWRPEREHRRTIALVGSYLGEVLRVRFGGRWADDPDEPGKPLFVQLHLGPERKESGSVCPLERAYHRLRAGDAEALLYVMEDVERQMTPQLQFEDAIAWTGQAADLLRRGRLDHAQRFLDCALRLDDSLAEAWFCNGVISERLGKRGDAEFAFRHAASLASPDDSELRGHVQAKLRGYRGPPLPHDDTEPPTNPDVLAAAVTQPWATGEFPSADGNVEPGARFRPNAARPSDEPTPQALTQDGLQLLSTGRFDRAAVCLRHALDAADHPPARVGLAVAELALGNPAGAIAALRPLVDAGHADATLLYARAQARAGRPRDAIASLSALSPSDAARADVLREKALNLLSVGDIDAAGRAFTRIVQRKPDDLDGWVGLARVASVARDSALQLAAKRMREALAHPALGATTAQVPLARPAASETFEREVD